MTWIDLLKRPTDVISKSTKVSLPTDGFSWANLIENEAVFNSQVKLIKEGHYHPKGVDSFLRILNDWKNNPDNWKEFSEIKMLYRDGKVPPRKIRERVSVLIEDVLPVVEGKRKGQKSKGGKSFETPIAYFGNRRNITEESLTKLFDSFFELNKEDQKGYLMALNKAFSDKRSRDKFRKFLTTKYGRQIRPLLKEFELTDGRMPIVSAFGIVKDESRLGKNYELIEPFTSDKAQYYLNSILSKRDLGADVFTDKLRELRKKDRYISYTLVELLDDKFTSSIEQGTLADDFINDVKGIKFTSENAQLNHYANIMWEVSNPFSDKFNSQHELFVEDVGTIADWREKEKKPNEKEFKKQFKIMLKSGDKKEFYKEKKRQLEVSMRIYGVSINQGEKDLIDFLIEQKEEEDNDEADVNMLEGTPVYSMLEDLNFKPRLKKEDLGPKTVTLWQLDKGTLEKVKNIISAAKKIDNEDLQMEIEGVEEETEENKRDFDAIYETLDEIQEFDFNKEAFPDEFSKDIAEITYLALIKGKALDEVLDGSHTKTTIKSLPNIFNVLLEAESLYQTSPVPLSTLAQEIKPTEDMDFTSDSPIYSEEIKAFSEAFKKSIENVREALIRDIKEKIGELITNPEIYKVKQKGHDLYSMLERNNLIQEVAKNEV